MLTIFATAFGLGLILSAAPGPVFAETVRRGIRGGFRPALAVQLGSVIGDMLWAVLGLAGIGLLLRLDILSLPVGIVSVIYLLWLAWDAWRTADQAFVVNRDGPEAAGARPTINLVYGASAQIYAHGVVTSSRQYREWGIGQQLLSEVDQKVRELGCCKGTLEI